MYRLHVKPYQWRLQPPLVTHHGRWAIREGIWVGLASETGQIGWGDIAPIPWLGTEAIADALNFCHQCPQALSRDAIFAIPDTLPACQFGFGSAWIALQDSLIQDSLIAVEEPAPAQVCGLLRAGKAALEDWQSLWQRGHCTFKWKIGVLPFAQEQTLFQQLMAVLPSGTCLRLDANGGLNLAEAHAWLKVCDRYSPSVEYLEQPLPPAQWADLMDLAHTYQTPVALDESVTTVAQLQIAHQQGWPGIMVIKPALAGYPQALSAFLNTHCLDVVFSSALETAIGRRMALHLAHRFQSSRPLGFGVQVPDGLML